MVQIIWKKFQPQEGFSQSRVPCSVGRAVAPSLNISSLAEYTSWPLGGGVVKPKTQEPEITVKFTFDSFEVWRQKRLLLLLK